MLAGAIAGTENESSRDDEVKLRRLRARELDVVLKIRARQGKRSFE
jgi:hypothetical protein